MILVVLSASSFSHILANENPKEKIFPVQAGDRLQISVFREVDLTGTYEVDPAGNLVFPLLGKMKAGGMSMNDLNQQISSGLKKYLVDPQVSITKTEASVKSISVIGHVKSPGRFDFQPGATLMRLISEAGGFAPSANKRKVRIVRVNGQGQKENLVINALDIVNGKGDDPEIQPGDMIFVPESVF